MVQMVDTEGKDLPGNKFNLSLYCGYKPREMVFTINVPMRFESNEGDYASGGVLITDVKPVFEEYLAQCISGDGGIGARDFATWLVDFAARLRAELDEHKDVVDYHESLEIDDSVAEK